MFRVSSLVNNTNIYYNLKGQSLIISDIVLNVHTSFRLSIPPTDYFFNEWIVVYVNELQL